MARYYSKFSIAFYKTRDGSKNGACTHSQTTPSNNEQVRLTSLREGQGWIFHISLEPFLKGRKDT